MSRDEEFGMSLNDPCPTDDAPDISTWTPAIGMKHAALRGVVTALLIAAALAFPATYVAPLVMGGARWFIALIVAWILFAVTQRASGMVGWPITSLAIGLTLLVLLSTNIVVAVNGLPTTKGVLQGWVLLGPGFLLWSNLTTPIGIIAAALFCHRGATLENILDILNQRHWFP